MASAPPEATLTLLNRAKTSEVIALSVDERDLLVDHVPVTQEVDTVLAGPLRVLEWEGDVWIQEETDKKQLLLRHLPGGDAETFVKDRMATYDRMWDGCGCRVRYHEKTR